MRKTSLIQENLYSLEEADVIVIGVPFDSTATEIPGARFAPMRIREAFQTHIEGFDPELGSLEDVKLHDAGNVEALHGNIEATHQRIYDSVKEIVAANPNARLLVLGGEHSITFPIVKALNETKKFNYLCYDAHTDFWDEYNGLKYSHACVNRRVSEILPTEVRGVREREPSLAAEVAKLKPVDDPIYLSVDVDVLEGVPTGAPIAGGMKLEELWRDVAKRKIIAADIVEYNPLVGQGIEAAELAKRLILKMGKQ